MSYTNADARCPQCAAEMTGATDPQNEDSAPSPGDFSVCLYCAAVLCFNDDMTVRDAADEDLDDLPGDLLAKLAHMRMTALLLIHRKRHQQ